MTNKQNQQPGAPAQDEQTPLRRLKKIGAAFLGFLIGVVSVQKPIDMLLDGRDTRVRKELEDQSTRSREWQ